MSSHPESADVQRCRAGSRQRQHRHRPPRRRPCRAPAACVLRACAALLLGCGGEAVVTLGAGAPVATFGDPGQRVRNINERTSNEECATLTEDLLEIYFVSDRDAGPGAGDIWRARRATRTDAFGPPEPVLELSSAATETSPGVSADGLTLWLASDRDSGLGQLDIWRSTRADREQPWSVPENVSALNSPLNDLPSRPGAAGVVLPFVSDRDGDAYQSYLAHARGGSFDDPRIEPLFYLWSPQTSMEDPFLSEDGRLLFFRRAPAGGVGDLYVAWRRPEQSEFIDPALLATINSAADERDPFLSSDQIRFFFSSAQRDGERFDIYATSITLPVFE
jgi:hypothetical protein